MSNKHHQAIELFAKSLLGVIITLTVSVAIEPVLFGQEEPVYETMPIAAEYQLPDESAVDKTDRAAFAKFNNDKKAILDKRRDMQRQAKDTLAGRTGSTSAIEGWFTGFALPEMAQTDDETLQQLGEIRQLFFRTYLDDTTNTNLRQQVLDLTIPAMKKIAEGNYHPACRINAVYVLGRLNAREGNRSSKILPQPVPELLTYLIQIATTETQPEFLRVAAISGVERHTSIQGAGSGNPLDSGTMRVVNDAMVTLITQGASEKLTRETNYWLKRRAITIIGNLGVPGDNGRYAKVLRDVIATKTEKMLVRTDAAVAYSRLDFVDASAANMAEIVELVAKLVIAAADADKYYIDDQINNIEFIAQFLDGKSAGDTSESKNSNQPSKGGLGGIDDLPETPAGGGPGGRNKSNVEVLPAYHRELVRRRFKHYLYSCRLTLVGGDRDVKGGLSRIAKDEDAKFIDALVAEFDKLMISTDIYEPDSNADEKDDKKKKDEPGKTGKGPGDEVKPQLTLADQLKKALNDGAAEITNVIAKFRPDQEPGLPGDDSVPPPEGSGG